MAVLRKLIVFLFLIQCAYSAKILGIFHGPAFSHQQLGSKLLRELASRGHEVTTIVPKQYAPKDKLKNFKVIEVDFALFPEDTMPNMFDLINTGLLSKIIFMEVMGVYMSDAVLNQTSVDNLLKSNEKFDMVIMEQFVNEAFRGFCYHYQAHCVIVSTIAATRWTNPQMGNPHFPSYVTEHVLTYPNKMNFYQRLVNTYLYAFSTLLFHLYALPQHNQILHKYFPNAPHVQELYYNTSLMLLNSHESIHAAQHAVPNMINIGGYHISPPKKLPNDLQVYLDNAKEGAIYFSMGSHIQPNTMPKEKLNAITKVLSKLKLKVLWKISNFTWHDKPAHVRVDKWYPQQEVLAHPNVVLFISHGGLLSTIETIYHGKPIVGVPVLGDQEMNVANAELNGFAKAVFFNDLTEETFGNAINEVLSNPKYTENAKRKSRIMHDQPMKPLDKAMFWLEYVLRHNGAPHLRTSALDLCWFQLYSLDVIAFTIVLMLVITYSLYQLLIVLVSVTTMKILLILTVLFALTHCVYSAKILGIFHGPSFSHQQLGSKLLIELASRGHEVTNIVPKQYAPKEKIKNYKVIEVDFNIFPGDSTPNTFDLVNTGVLSKLIFMEVFGVFLSDAVLNNTSIDNLLKSDEKFDLVIMEQFVNEAFRGFCYHYKAHCVVVSTMAASRWTNPQMGNPHFPSYMPEMILTYPTVMNFCQRLINSYVYAFSSLVFYFLLVSVCYQGAKILGIFHGPSFSHQQLGSKLLIELASRGHEVTNIVPKQYAPKEKIKNYKVIEVDFNIFPGDSTPNTFDLVNTGVLSKLIFMEVFGVFLSDAVLNNTSIDNLLKSDEKFDLVIMEQFVNEAFRGFCYHYKAHCVVVSTMAASRWTNPQMGNPHFPSYMPEMILTYPTVMNFCQRLINSYVYAFSSLVFYLYGLPQQNKVLHKYFPDAPHINELYYNTSLMLLNSHESIHAAEPSVPNMIKIGGYHINPPKKLPKDLQEYLDGAKEGAIYFSMGSHIQPNTMPKEKLNAIIKVISKLKQKVLWKISNFTWHDKPAHIRVDKWFPQQEVLAHPNVVLFISHGGLLSTIETIYHGKPIVGVPVLGDQEMNVANAELNGFAKAVFFNDLTEESFEKAITEVLSNPKYAENAKRKSKIMHDQPMKPLDTAMFWIEYVLRHNGAPHLKTSALDLCWFQMYSLDVLAFTLILLVVISYISCKLCKIVASSICKKTKKPKAQQKKKKQ
ncbi:hypothetical protein FQR65_LT14402 [Abscondita terminalis]|nr:hypothetical protein FQR65_LT14402 [Abscondita terminalis]